MSSISQGVSGHQSVEEYRRGRLVGFPVRPSQSQRLAGLAVRAQCAGLRVPARRLRWGEGQQQVVLPSLLMVLGLFRASSSSAVA